MTAREAELAMEAHELLDAADGILHINMRGFKRRKAETVLAQLHEASWKIQQATQIVEQLWDR